MSNGMWLDNESHYINFRITECYYAVWIQDIKNHGAQFYRCILEGEHSAVFVGNPMHGMECAMFKGCVLRGGKASVLQSWEGRTNDELSLMFSACTFQSPIEWTGGYLVIADCAFDFEGRHLSIGPDTKNAIIADSRFKGERGIDNRAGSKVEIGDSRARYIHPQPHTCDANRISTYKPRLSESLVVQAGEGKADDATILQSIVDGVSQQGGGYVVLSPGVYMLESPLVIRKNVELRGNSSHYNGLEKPGAPIRWIRLRSDTGCRRRIHGEKRTEVHPGV